MKNKGLYTGSFDPITNGHFNIIKRAAKICDELVVGVIENPQKKSFFDLEKRKEIIEEATKDMPNVKVVTFSGLLADFVNKNDFNIVVRGLRNGQDFNNEIAMAQVNAKLFNNKVETIFLMTSPEHAFVSSSMVREIAALRGNVKELVPQNVYKEFQKIYN